MKTMTLRNVPDALHARLKESARRNRRTLSQQVIVELRRVDLEARVRKKADAERLIREVEEVRARIPGFLTAEEIDAAKRVGRA
ncbi:MAG: hypothetical protein JJU00_02880 [Opitutales bacterium]|nr:hypothetical protein [Opitutales bacterium]